MTEHIEKIRVLVESFDEETKKCNGSTNDD